MKHEYFADIDW